MENRQEIKISNEKIKMLIRRYVRELHKGSYVIDTILDDNVSATVIIAYEEQ